ncbi:glucosaminidase domain-containing protein [Thermotoga profunda]|uniref:glucosaminidase domain-containing protein n=1 Tax=Thermotoga profunda TaxID=1508420 RepID=UPI000694046B|nr:glucosaminidase domain-containing protein [Thermotoga profunda]
MIMILALTVLFVTVPKFTFELVSYFENFETEEDQVVELGFDSYKDLLEFFEKIGYDLGKKEVPAVILKNLPKDMNQIKDVQLKKDLFVKIMLPIILKVNEEIKQEREKIMKLTNDSQELQHYLAKYKAKTKQELLEKVDVIPVEIALAQAAIESAWGTSRFAIEANNIFGEWTFSPGNGVVPRERPDDEVYEVRRFRDLLSSMRSYAYNLNVSPFYKEFRAIRAGKIKKPIEEGLLYYSQRREKYIQEIKIIMTNNKFTELKEHKAYPIQIALISGMSLIK